MIPMPGGIIHNIPMTRAAGSVLLAVLSMTVNPPQRTSFQQITDVKTDGSAVTIGEFTPPIAWDEMVLSWNVDAKEPGEMRVYVTASNGGKQSMRYCMGRWSFGDLTGTSESFKDQKDEMGQVLTDTLRMATPAEYSYKLEAEFKGTAPKLKLFGVSLLNSKQHLPADEPHKEVWGTVLDAPQLSQMSYPNGKVLCSPTCVAMALQYWSRAIERPDWTKDVPEVAPRVFDKTWGGTGNWSFNTAFAGGVAGMRGVVRRLDTLAQTEDLISAGIPVICSVSFAMLQGSEKRKGDDGHLVMLVGFNKEGEPVFNDPGWSKETRQTYRRANFERAWNVSNRTVYLIYPESKEADLHKSLGD